MNRCLHKDQFKLSNFCTSQNTVSVQPDVGADDGHTHVQPDQPAVVHVQPVYMVDEEPPDVQLSQPVEEEHPVLVQSMLPAVVDVQSVYPVDEEPQHVQPYQPAVVRVQLVYITSPT